MTTTVIDGVTWRQTQITCDQHAAAFLPISPMWHCITCHPLTSTTVETNTSSPSPNIDNLYQALFAAHQAVERAFTVGDMRKAFSLGRAFHDVADLIAQHTGDDPRTEDGPPVDRRA